MLPVSESRLSVGRQGRVSRAAATGGRAELLRLRRSDNGEVLGIGTAVTQLGPSDGAEFLRDRVADFRTCSWSRQSPESVSVMARKASPSPWARDVHHHELGVAG
jgi:hypothetical protein